MKNFVDHRLERFLLFAAAICLLLQFAIRYWLQALGKPFWGDEMMSILTMQNTSLGDLVWHGQRGEANRSPLVYIVDTLLSKIYGFYPQQYWDLRLFYRLSHAAYWSIACTCVFTWVLTRIKIVFPQVRQWETWIIAIGISYFLYFHSFLNIYAIESRPYSLWVSLSIIHFLFTIDALYFQPNKIRSVPYLLVCFFLTLTTYAAFCQVMLGLLAWCLARWEEAAWRLKAIPRFAFRSTLPAFVAALVPTYWYLSSYSLGQFQPAPVSLMVLSVREVLLKSFHHHGVQPFFVTGPLFMLLVPWLYRRNPKALALETFLWGNILLAVVLYVVSRLKGGIFAPRYAIFLVPTFTFIYLRGLYWAANLLTSLVLRLPFPIWKRWQVTVLTLLACFFLIEIGSRIGQMARELPLGFQNFKLRHAYGKTVADESSCGRNFSGDVNEFEAMNDRCRAGAAPLSR